MKSATSSRTLLFFWAFSLVLLPPDGLRSDESKSGSSIATHSAIQDASELAGTLIDHFGLPSMSIAVATGGQLLWAEAFGYADLENGVLASPTSKYRVGSVSKTLTSFAIGVLVEQGALDIDVPISRYLPLYPETQWPMTTRQLASHTAGVRDYLGDEFLSATPYSSVQTSLGIFAQDPLRFEPGTQYQYSTFGWSVVSAVIEAAARSEFRTIMKRTVLDPIGMDSTIAEEMRPLIRNRVGYYEWDERGALRNAPYVDTSNKWAGGGYLSTPTDIARFGIEYLHGSLLSTRMRSHLTQQQRLVSGETVGYGLGWEVRTDPHGRRIVGHSGGSIGGTTMFFIWPSVDLIIVIASNITDDPGLRLAAYAIGETFMHSNSAVETPEQDCNSLALSDVKSDVLDGTVDLMTTGSGISGSITVKPIVSSGKIIHGWIENDKQHLVIATDREIFHACLKSSDSFATGFLLDARGEAYWVRLETVYER